MRKVRWGGIWLSIFMVLAMVAAVPALADPKDGRSKSDHNKPEGNDPDPEPEEYGPTTKGDTSCNEEGSGGRFDETCNDSAKNNGGNPADGKHGNGGNGKCAGCDGKADNQDPPGQSRNDHNNGYECDHNGGVGKGNPSHSRCVPEEEDNDRRRRRRPSPSPTTIPAPPIENPSIPGQPCDKDMNPANGIQACVLGVRLRGNPRTPGVAPAATPGQPLPFTGSRAPVTPFVVLALGLMTAGGILVRFHLPKPKRVRK
jgi:hypothetical protein